MAYADLLTIQTLNTGDILTAAAMTQVRNNDEFLIDPPACSVFNSAVQSITNNTLTALTANSEFFDNAAMHSTSTNTSRITATTAGRYEVCAAVNWAASATGERLLEFFVNATTRYGAGVYPAPATVAQTVGSRTITLAAGDYVECRVRQISGGALDATLLEFVALFRTR